MAEWELSGTVLVGCNCDYGCPCNFNAPPTNGDCEGGWVWNIDKGRYGDVELDGLTLGVLADWPKAIHEGGGKAVAFYDERADERQREALENLLRGGEGGPWGIFINTYELEAIRPERFELHLDGVHSTARVGDAIALEMTTIKNPVTGAEVHPGAVLPEGLVCKQASFGKSETFRVSAEIEYDHSGQYVAAAPFDYAGP